MDKTARTKAITLSIIGIVAVSIFVGITIFLTQDTEEDTSNSDSSTVVVEETNQDIVEPQDSEVTDAIPSPVEPAELIESATASVASNYVDGQYSETVTYISPGGPHPITVNLTLASDIITSVNVEMDNGGNSTTILFQGGFDEAYEGVVTGQDINEVSLSRVGGASLTSGGFNEAIEAIKLQARN